MGSAGTLVVGIILVILGVILRWNLIDWVIDTAGLIILIVGIILIVFGLFHIFADGKKGESGY